MSAQEKQAPESILEGISVLVVDDIEDNCEILRMILEHFGATVHVARDGLKAFKMAIKVQPRLIITDLSMPGIDGWQFIDMLQNEPRTENTKIIALTALAWESHPEFTERPDFTNYLAKPVDAGTLIKQIQSLFTVEELRYA